MFVLGIDEVNNVWNINIVIFACVHVQCLEKQGHQADLTLVLCDSRLSPSLAFRLVGALAGPEGGGDGCVPVRNRGAALSQKQLATE